MVTSKLATYLAPLQNSQRQEGWSCAPAAVGVFTRATRLTVVDALMHSYGNGSRSAPELIGGKKRVCGRGRRRDHNARPPHRSGLRINNVVSTVADRPAQGHWLSGHNTCGIGREAADCRRRTGWNICWRKN